MAESETVKVSRVQRALAAVERFGNKLPDPAVLFIALIFIVWLLSWLLSYATWSFVDPRSQEPIVVINQLTGEAFTTFLTGLVTNFVQFGPVGTVLVAMLGIGVAEHSGFITTGIRALLNVTATRLLTPMVILVGIVSHSAVDAGYVLVIPIGGVIFYAAGRHPLAGIAAAFAGVSGGFSANFVPSALDPLLQGLTQGGAQLLDPAIEVNTLNNYFFTTASSVLIISLGWWITDKIVEPRISDTPVDGAAEDLPELHDLKPEERRGLRWALIVMALGLVLLTVTLIPAASAWRDANGNLATFQAPIMRSIVALVFLFFLIPGMVFGYVAGTLKGMKDVIEGMTHSMHQMAYYLVIMFFIAQFVYAFGASNLGTLLALAGAEALKGLRDFPSILIIGIVLLTGLV
ncbi:MAG: AbgT family transporter, partial [Gammaproteobacteria bacterium]|nr:AbgT family transporter [Gammaproteobacteria bacterium]